MNPLLTMLVQYLVFSTIFKSTIENFIVYLLSGIILFNFFGEAVGLGLNSIIDNGHLINKVYMPKIIYPLSRVLSSSINLFNASSCCYDACNWIAINKSNVLNSDRFIKLTGILFRYVLAFVNSYGIFQRYLVFMEYCIYTVDVLNTYILSY